MKRAAFGIAFLAVAVACSDTTEPRSFAVSATVDRPSVVVGDSVNFVIQAQGNALALLAVEFGDSTGFNRDLFGATTMTANQKHAYSAPGNYTMTAVVTAASGEMKQTTVGVTVR
jgi:PKD repeat protein